MTHNAWQRNAVCFAAPAYRRPDAFYRGKVGELMRRQPRYQTTHFLAWLALQNQVRGKTNGANSTLLSLRFNQALSNDVSVVALPVRRSGS
jgi:hypothetical protein